MTERKGYAELQDVVLDPEFPELDLALRRGRHVDREDFAWFTLLTDAQDHLETFYRRYGCELIHKADGYFYLLPSGEKLSRRQLGAGDMLVGQALALLYLDPSTIERGGRITGEDVVAQLVVVLGSDALIRAFNPSKRKKLDERVAQKNVRGRIGEAIRHLAALGFVDIADDDALKLRPALLRFAEPVRGLSAPAEALAKLVAEGEISLVDEETDEARDDERSADEEREVVEVDGADELEAAAVQLEAAANARDARDAAMSTPPPTLVNEPMPRAEPTDDDDEDPPYVFDLDLDEGREDDRGAPDDDDAGSDPP